MGERYGFDRSAAEHFCQLLDGRHQIRVGVERPREVVVEPGVAKASGGRLDGSDLAKRSRVLSIPERATELSQEKLHLCCTDRCQIGIDSARRCSLGL